MVRQQKRLRIYNTNRRWNRFIRHHTNIDMEGYKTLTDNQKVSYKVGDSDRGPSATNVTV